MTHRRHPPHATVLAVLAVLALAPGIGRGGGKGQIAYPETRRVDHVDVYHEVEVPDPYRWLEVDVRESEAVRRWVEAQNELTFAYLSKIPEREAIRRRLTELWNYERYSTPFKRAGRYYFEKNDGLQDQDVLYTMGSLVEEPRILIDPNRWSEDGTVALAGLGFPDGGRHLAYGVAEAGSDWRTWRVMDLGSGEVLPEGIEWMKFSRVAWTKDGEGFFYSRYEEPEEGAEYQTLNLNQKVYYHRLGTPQAKDTLVYHRPAHPEWSYDAQVTDDGRYLVLTIWKGTAERYRVYWRDLQEPYALPVPLIDEFSNEYTFIANDGPLFYFKTDLDAPKRRLVAIDVTSPAPGSWREIVPEAEDTLVDVSLVGNLFIAEYLKDAQTVVRLFTKDGRHVRDVELPGIGSARGFEGRPGDAETFYTFSSFATPPSVYRYDVATGASHLLFHSQVDFDPEAYEVRQVFYPSRDGTRVPMFLAHRKGISLDGSNPTLLYGYGGFNISLTPYFSVSRLAWMELGGVFAMPNLRGGGEYGETWHEAGMKLNKQNVFDDFIAAAEWLVDNGYTRPGKLAIHGGSNGGLLVGAVLTQRPDLFGAALPEVGVMDMLRFHKFTAGRFWVDDYGSADDPEEFRALLAYSPYHNIEKGTAYPATLATTADTDDRVVPAHSFKFTAALQAAQGGEEPILIRIETRAGHGAGTPTSKRIQEVADLWSFLVENLDFELPPGYPGSPGASPEGRAQR